MSDKGLAELFAEIGNEKLEYQTVHGSFVGSKEKKRDTEVTFATNQINTNQLINNTGKIGLIVWINSDDFKAAQKAVNES